MVAVCILQQDTYKPGDLPPEGYLQWHEWARVQHAAGLRQSRCGRCGLWKYPQELSDEIDRCEMQSYQGSLAAAMPVCNECRGAG